MYGVLGRLKSSAAYRELRIDEGLCARLIEWRESQRKSARNQFDLVFPSRSGTAIYNNNLRKNFWIPLTQAAGIGRIKTNGVWQPGIRLHDLRHAFASIRIAENATGKQLQTELGHADFFMTHNRYGHVMDNLSKSEHENAKALLKLSKTPLPVTELSSDCRDEQRKK
ncbi:MAG: hypothetical protein Alpg2KO_14320 [Alphaproteobacteria bacterium]